MTDEGARTLRLGTRGSALALAQSGLVAAQLRALGRPVELVTVTTYGDTSPAAITELGGTGVFVTALREALLAGEVDLAVHSYKDLPTAVAPGLQVAAVPPRADPRDALVARGGLTLAELPAGATVGTGSPRRRAQLRALGRGLDVVGLRGNVDTRVRAVREGRLDAVVLAHAGLMRLGRGEEVSQVLGPELMLPAPAQGALAVECRGDDADVVASLARLDDAPTRAAVAAERALLAELEAGCTAPVAALAQPAGTAPSEASFLRLTALVAADDGTVLRASARGDVGRAAELGRRLAAELLDRGATGLLAASTMGEQR